MPDPSRDVPGSPAANRETRSPASASAGLTCHVCVFYAEMETGARVLPVVEGVIGRHRRITRSHLHLWPLEALGQPPLAERAFACADIADAVVVAGEVREAADGLLDWLDRWQQRRTDVAMRLLVMFYPPPENRIQGLPTFRHLANFAAQSGVGLVTHVLPEIKAVSFPEIHQEAVGH